MDRRNKKVELKPKNSNAINTSSRLNELTDEIGGLNESGDNVHPETKVEKLEKNIGEAKELLGLIPDTRPANILASARWFNSTTEALVDLSKEAGTSNSVAAPKLTTDELISKFARGFGLGKDGEYDTQRAIRGINLAANKCQITAPSMNKLFVSTNSPVESKKQHVIPNRCKSLPSTKGQLSGCEEISAKNFAPAGKDTELKMKDMLKTIKQHDVTEKPLNLADLVAKNSGSVHEAVDKTFTLAHLASTGEIAVSAKGIVPDSADDKKGAQAQALQNIVIQSVEKSKEGKASHSARKTKGLGEMSTDSDEDDDDSEGKNLQAQGNVKRAGVRRNQGIVSFSAKQMREMQAKKGGSSK